MNTELEQVLPAQIEKRSFEIITEELGDRVFITGTEPIVKRWLRQGRGWEDLAALILEENRGLILICDEIGCGLVPVDAFEREYRESTGRIKIGRASCRERV